VRLNAWTCVETRPTVRNGFTPYSELVNSGQDWNLKRALAQKI